MDIALSYLRQALELRQSLRSKEETLFAIAYLLLENDLLNTYKIAKIVKQLVTDDKECAILLLMIAKLAQDQRPELIITIGELLRDINDPIQWSEWPKLLQKRKELMAIETIGELLAAILQKTIEFSQADGFRLESMLRGLGFWPREVELSNLARYTSTKIWVVFRK